MGGHITEDELVVLENEWVRAIAENDLDNYENAAVVLADLKLGATVREEARSGDFAVTDVWVRRDGRWQVVARSSIFSPQSSGT